MFLISLATGFQLSPASALRNSPSRIAANITFGFSGFTANPFTVRRVGGPPPRFPPPKQPSFSTNPPPPLAARGRRAVAALSLATDRGMELRGLVRIDSHPVDVEASEAGVHLTPGAPAVLAPKHPRFVSSDIQQPAVPQVPDQGHDIKMRSLCRQPDRLPCAAAILAPEEPRVRSEPEGSPVGGHGKRVNMLEPRRGGRLRVLGDGGDR